MDQELNVAPAESPFWSCSSCGQRWATLSDFLSDVNVRLVGYQVDFNQLEAGLFLFNHITPKCGTTLACRAGNFKSLYNGPIFRECLTGGQQCPGYCQKRDMLAVCPAKCECAYVREILDIVNRWPKKQAG